MSNIESSRFTRTDPWREGAWLDLWSVVHTLSGISLGFVFYLIHLGSIASAILVLLLLILYEMWEALVRIEETPTNRFMDVVVGMVGYVLAFFIFAPLLSQRFFILACGFTVLTDIVMSVFGWRASQKAAALKERVHTRYTTERARLMEQKQHLQKRFKQ